MQLARWVSEQRQQMKRGTLSPERIRLLQENGFTWEIREASQPWEVRYMELLQFKERHGDCDVPTEYQANPALGKWVSKQRGNKKNGKLTLEQERLLNEAGFIWEKRAGRHSR